MLANLRGGQGSEVATAAEDESLVAELSHETILGGRDGGPAWFHPRACRLPVAGGGASIGMTMQSISGSDVFGPVHWTEADTNGEAWSEPTPLAGFGRRTLDGGYEEGVCDVVPEYHATSGSVLAMGHNVFYREGVLARPQRRRHPVYAVRNSDGSWSAPARLAWEDKRASFIYSCGCAQRFELPGGDVLVPLTFGSAVDTPRSVTTARCSFDGRQLAIQAVGTVLEHKVKRGLLEPSVTHLDGRFYLTIRAEDERGYVAVSDDGLAWSKPQAWSWDDGEPLLMSTTQQRWLTHREGLFLVYTRRDATNEKVFRWRAPLYLAQVDRDTLRLLRASERIVLPLLGDARQAPQHVAQLGNFHTVNATPDESWVTVGEARPADGWRGDVLLARVRWRKPNRLVDSPS